MVNWKDRVLEWANGKIFHYLSTPWIPRFRVAPLEPPRCEACGSRRVESFYLLQYEDQFILVGRNCGDLLWSKKQIVNDIKYERSYLEELEKRVIEEKTK